MSHFTVAAIFPFGVDNLKNIENLMANKDSFITALSNKIAKPFGAYDINKEISPYKRYLDDEEIQKMSKYYGISKSDLNLLKEKAEDWSGDKESGVDEKGLFTISTANYEGIYDTWEAYDVMLTEDLLRDEDLVCDSILTPECQLIRSEQSFYNIGDSNEKEFLAWKQKYQDILKSYLPNSFVLLIDCHI